MPLFRQRKRNEELEDEVKAHLAIDVQQRILRGESPEEARANARREFGNVALVQEVTRRMWQWNVLDAAGQEARFAIRYALCTFRREPILTALTILMLALAFGTNTLLFTGLSVLMKQSTQTLNNAFRKNGLNISVVSEPPGMTDALAHRRIAAYGKNNPAFESIAAVSFSGAMNVRFDDGLPARSLSVTPVGGRFFEISKMLPEIGRLFAPADDAESAEPVAVISKEIWKTRFGSQPSVLGRTLKVRGRAFRIVGVLSGNDDSSGNVWVPFSKRTASDSVPMLMMVGRLKPGVTLAQATTFMEKLEADFEAANPDASKASVGLIDGNLLDFDTIVFFAPAILALFAGIPAATLAVFLIAWANISAMALARASARREEIAVRLALGAPRHRLVLQLLAETSMMFLAAAFLAVWSPLLFYKDWLGTDMGPPSALMYPHWPVVLLTFALALAATLGAGLIPAWIATRRNLNTVLTENSLRTTYRKSPLRDTLVVAQISMSIVLLICSGLFTRSLQRISTDVGFDPDGVQIVTLQTGSAGVQQAELQKLGLDLVDEVSSLPGVDSASVVTDLPLDDENPTTKIAAPTSDSRESAAWFDVPYSDVGPGYFETLRIPILNGGDFPGGDRNNANTAIISQRMAEKFWPGSDPVGKRYLQCAQPVDTCSVQIIGVAGNIRNDDFAEADAGAFIYRPFGRESKHQVSLLFRSTDIQRVIPSVRKTIAAVNPDLPIGDVMRLRENMSAPTQEISAVAAGTSGTIGLVLAALGIYGATAYEMISRKRELVLRTTLGGSRASVIRLALRQSMKLACIGIVLGCAASLGVARQIAHYLWSVSIADPAIYLLISAVVAAVSFFAAYLPARQTLKANPMATLRQ